MNREAADDDDYDVYESNSPIRSKREAWLGVAGVLAFTVLVAWLWQTFLDHPGGATVGPAPSATLGDMRLVPPGSPTPLFSNAIAPTPRRLLVDVVLPETLGGRAKSSEERPAPSDYLRTLTDGSLVWGAYGELVTTNFVVLSAATSAYLQYPDQEIDILIDHLQADDPNLAELSPVPAGTLGGVARCGSSMFADLPKAVCVWAADQSVGVVTWIDQPLELAKAEFLALREQIEVPR